MQFSFVPSAATATGRRSEQHGDVPYTLLERRVEPLHTTRSDGIQGYLRAAVSEVSYTKIIIGFGAHTFFSFFFSFP